MGLNQVLAALDDVPNTESGRVFRIMLIDVVGNAFVCAAPDIVDGVLRRLKENLRLFNAIVDENIDE